MLPDKYKIENNESSQKKIEDAKKVAAAGLEGKSKGMFTRERILESNAAVWDFIQPIRRQCFQNSFFL